MGLTSTLFMKCEDATAVVEKKRDGKLSFAEKIGLWLHLLYCKLCTSFFHQSEMIDKSYHNLAKRVDDEKQSFSFDPSKKEQMKAAFQEELQK